MWLGSGDLLDPAGEGSDLVTDGGVVGCRSGGVADAGELFAQRCEPGGKLIDPWVGRERGGGGGGGELLAGAFQGVRELVRRDGLGREAPLEVVELCGQRGLALTITGELLDPCCERLELLLNCRVVDGLSGRAHLGELRAHLREVVGEPVDPGIRRLIIAERCELPCELVDARIGERCGGRGQILPRIGERPGEMLRCDDVGRQPGLDLLESCSERLLRLALGRQVVDAVGDLLDPVRGRDRLGERGDLVADGGKALAELVEPLRRSGVLLGREALADLGEGRAQRLNLRLELLQARRGAVVPPRHLVEPHPDLRDGGCEAFVLINACLQARGKGLHLAGIRLGGKLLRKLGLDPGEPLVELGIADGPRLELDDGRSQLGERQCLLRERPRLLIQSRRRAGVLGEHRQPLLECHQRLVQRDDLIGRDDVLDAGREGVQPALDLCRIGNRAFRKRRHALLDRGQ